MNKNKNDRNNHPEETNDFYDTKIYQQVLKEFLSVSADTPSHHPSSGAINASALRASLAARKRTLNNKGDCRASKGRKTRYIPIPKLAYFAYPLSRPTSGTRSRKMPGSDPSLEEPPRPSTTARVEKQDWYGQAPADGWDALSRAGRII